jgi:hypothetical protein
MLMNHTIKHHAKCRNHFQMRGSNWRLKSVRKLEINTVACKPLKGKSYIPLLKKLAAEQAIINMQNEDDECFKRCVVRALNPVEERITKQLTLKPITIAGVEFPLAVDENARIEAYASRIPIY